MSKLIRDLVTGYGITFEVNHRNHEAFDRALEQWNTIDQDLASCRNDGSIILFCGAKNNGKSSLVRYLVNKYNGYNPSLLPVNLRKSDHTDLGFDGTKTRDRYAYYVDFDPGQCEMSTPGVVSAHIIRQSDQPLTSPTYLNLFQHELVHTSSVGGTSMSVNPRAYIENCRCVFEAVLKHREINGQCHPIFINTMGFIRGVGLAILLDLIKLCRPTILVVLNIEHDFMRTIYTDFDPLVVSKLRPSFYRQENLDIKTRKLRYRSFIYNLRFSFVDSKSIAVINRVALQIGYFSSIPESLYKPVLQIEPKILHFHKVWVHCVSSYPLKPHLIIDILPNSWVHLVKLKTKHQSNNLVSNFNEDPPNDNVDQKICKIVDNVEGNSMLGCGILVGIDLRLGTFLVITPLDQVSLDQEVDCIIKPLSIQVPRQFLTSQ